MFQQRFYATCESKFITVLYFLFFVPFVDFYEHAGVSFLGEESDRTVIFLITDVIHFWQVPTNTVPPPKKL